MKTVNVKITSVLISVLLHTEDCTYRAVSKRRLFSLRVKKTATAFSKKESQQRYDCFGERKCVLKYLDFKNPMRSVVNDKASSGVGMYKEIYGPDSEKRTKLKFEKMLI